MKIGVWILADYKPQIGGGFSLYEKLIKQIDEFTFADGIEVCFVGHNAVSNYNFKKKYYCVNPLKALPSFITDWTSLYAHKSKWLSNRECDILRKNKIELIYYPVQGFRKVANFPFIATNWDTGHKSSFAFPEVTMNGTLEYREKWYGKDIYKALLVFAESEAGKEELLCYTKLNPERVVVVPLFAGGVVDVMVDEKTQLQKLQHFNLKPKNYFFYPAQFWAHKNHYNLLQAFKVVAANQNVFLVLSGSDKGNKKYIQQVVQELGLTDKVKFLGFIDNESMVSLYRNALAMIMPTFYGPTNMPLLEALELDCPVLCTDLKGHREQLKDSAVYFNPTDTDAMVAAMNAIGVDNFRNELLTKAQKVKTENSFTLKNAITAINIHFIRIKAVRKTWGADDRIF